MIIVAMTIIILTNGSVNIAEFGMLSIPDSNKKAALGADVNACMFLSTDR